MAFPRVRHQPKKVISFYSFFAGMIVVLVIVGVTQPFLWTSLTRNDIHEELEWKTSSSIQKYLNRVASSPFNNNNHTMLHILLLETHLEGNLGDEMETMPLLLFLKNGFPSFSVSITVALSGWLEGPEKQLSYRSVREHGKIDHILTFQDVQALHDTSGFDLIVLAPGPWKLCRLHNNLWKDRRIDVLFGGSIITENYVANHDQEPCNLDTLVKNWNTKLIAVRETRSYRKMKQILHSTTSLILSGDLTHAFPLAPATYDFWKSHYRKDSRYPSTMSIVFSRANNAMHSMSIKGRTVVLKIWTDDNQNATITLPANEVIFASSSAIEDAHLFQDWMYKYYDRFQQHQFVICDTVEQLLGLIVNAHHVYTDRYHPGVAAHRLGVDFTILRYEEERDKLIGLRDLVYKDKYTAKKIQDEVNAHAFERLGVVMEKAITEKKQRNRFLTV